MLAYMKIHELFAAMWAMWLRGQPPPLHTSVSASPVGAGDPPQHVQVSSKGPYPHTDFCREGAKNSGGKTAGLVPAR